MLGCEIKPIEALSERGDKIVNGFQSGTNRDTNAIAFFRDIDGDGLPDFLGNGIALDDHWILTAAHVVAEVFDPFMSRTMPSGNLSADNFLIGYFGQQAAFIEAPLSAMVVEPNAQVVVGTGAPQHYTGRYLARNIELRPGVALSLH